MIVSAVILDMDGLMLDTETLARAAWQRAAAGMGFPIDDGLFETFIGRRDADCEEILAARFGETFSLDVFRERSRAVWQEIVDASGIATKPGLPELLALCAARSLPVAIATSSTRVGAARKLAAAGITHPFAAIVTGDEVERGKPAPDIYLEAARRLGVAPERCVAVEDSSAGALAASRAGMVTLIVPEAGRAPTVEAQAAASRVLGSLHEVANHVSGWCGGRL